MQHIKYCGSKKVNGCELHFQRKDINMENEKRINWAISAAAKSAVTIVGENRVNNVSVHYGCVEPGYDGSESIWVLGDWNDVYEWDGASRVSRSTDSVMSRLRSVLEKMGAETDWEDEWSACSECQKLFRTSPDSYGWQPSFVDIDDERICTECAKGEEIFEKLEGDSSRCNSNAAFDPENYGYVKLDEFERGFHRGQDADPRLIGEILHKAGFRRYVFNIDSVGQFDTKFSVWLHEEEAEREDGMGLIEAKYALENGTVDGPSVSEGMERALREATAQADKLDRGSGVIVSTITPDGAKTRVVSAEQFIEGKAFDDE